MTRSRRRNASPRAYQSQHERIEALEKSRDHWRRRAREAEHTERLSCGFSDSEREAVTSPLWTELWDSLTKSTKERDHLESELHESEQSAHFWRRVAGYSVAACGLILAAAAVFW